MSGSVEMSNPMATRRPQWAGSAVSIQEPCLLHLLCRVLYVFSARAPVLQHACGSFWEPGCVFPHLEELGGGLLVLLPCCICQDRGPWFKPLPQSLVSPNECCSHRCKLPHSTLGGQFRNRTQVMRITWQALSPKQSSPKFSSCI